MSLFSKSFVCLFAVAVASIIPVSANAQIFGGGNAGPLIEFQNTVDFDLTPVIGCEFYDPTEDAGTLREFVCLVLLPFLVDDLLEAEAFCDAVFVGYRDDIPSVLRNQLVDPVFINVIVDEIDGPGGVLAQAGPIAGIDTDGDGEIDLPGILSIIPPPYLQTRRFRAWSVPRFAQMTIDLEDIPLMVFSDTMVCTAVHEAFHALGHPSTFEISNLNQPSTPFGSPNFVGDRFGPNGHGYGITEYRIESENPLAEFVPLSPGDGSAHLSGADPTFFDFNENLQEVFLAVQGFGTNYMSRTLRGMYADMGYKIRGVNAFGIIDIDGDGSDDLPLIVNPIPDDG